jgi:hypothetical protein
VHLLWSTGKSEELVLGRHTCIIQRQLAEGGFSEVFLVTARASDSVGDSSDSGGGSSYALKRVLCSDREKEEAASFEIRVHKV